MIRSLVVLGAAGASLIFAAQASAQPGAGAAVCKLVAEVEAENWEPMVAMMDAVLENPDQTAEQRTNAQTKRAEAVMMRDAALELAARFKEALDPTPAETEALRAIDEDQFYGLLEDCDWLDDDRIAALLDLERGRALNAKTDSAIKAALDDLEGKVPFSRAVANDYATRVNCAAAHTAFANSFARENRDSAVYLLARKWGDALLANVYQIAGNSRRADNDVLGVYPEWTKNPSQEFRSACAGLLIVDGEQQVLALPPPPSSLPASPAPAPAQPKNLFTETIWLGDEVFKQFKPDISGFLIGYARYADGMDQQVLLLQLLPHKQGKVSMIAHQYSVNCNAGTIWWLQQRMLDDSAGIVSVVPNASSPSAPSNALGKAILNASCRTAFTGDVARSASGWRETAPIR